MNIEPAVESLISALFDPACVCSSDGTILAANKPFALQFAAGENACGIKLFGLIEGLPPMVSGCIGALPDTREALPRAETVLEGKAFAPRLCEVTAVALRGGEPLVALVFRDISEMAALREQLKIYRRAVEQSPATVVITNTGGEIEYVNPKFSMLTGYSREEAIGANPRILKSGRQGPEFYRGMWETLLAGREWRGEFHNLKKNGDSYWESASISPITDEHGAITHYIAVKEDITARKEAEEALRVRNAQMQKDLMIAQSAHRELMQSEVPQSSCFRWAFRYMPLDEVGGDFFAIYDIDGFSMAVIICDVSGHGVAAALFTALVKSAAGRILKEHFESPSDYLATLNRELKGNMSSYYMTGIYGIATFDPASGKAVFRYANAGHPLPALVRRDGSVSLQGASNTIIGILDDPGYIEQTIALEAGDRLFLYTDGISETVNPGREALDTGSGLSDLFAMGGQGSAESALDAIIKKVNEFRGAQPPEDDISLVILEVMG